MTKILVVEDDRMIRHLMSRRLALAGHEVVLAEDGEAGVQQALAELPDLIIMDIGLPKLNGWLATQRIRATPATRHIPIIAVTAYAMQQDRERCMIAGCNDYETKPVNFKRLLVKIDALLAQTMSESPMNTRMFFIRQDVPV
jgi:two-component system, cell cycle response regulator DivK